MLYCTWCIWLFDFFFFFNFYLRNKLPMGLIIMQKSINWIIIVPLRMRRRRLRWRKINFKTLKSSLSNLWLSGRGVFIHEFGPKFFHSVDRNRVIEGGPWSFSNHLLVTHLLQPGEVSLEVPFHKTLFWIKSIICHWVTWTAQRQCYLVILWTAFWRMTWLCAIEDGRVSCI